MLATASSAFFPVVPARNQTFGMGCAALRVAGRVEEGANALAVGASGKALIF
jgi:hypothetical protein